MSLADDATAAIVSRTGDASAASTAAAADAMGAGANSTAAEHAAATKMQAQQRGRQVRQAHAAEAARTRKENGDDDDVALDMDDETAAGLQSPGVCEKISLSLRAKSNRTRVKLDKAYGMDPYVSAKIGVHSHELQRTLAFVSNRKELPEVYRNPVYAHVDDLRRRAQLGQENGIGHAPSNAPHTTGFLENQLIFERGTTHDDGMVYIEAWHEGVLRDEFIGGCTTPVETIIKECSKSGEGKWTVMTFDLVDQETSQDTEQKSDDGYRDAGALEVRVLWEPGETSDCGTLRINVLRGLELRDVSQRLIRDVRTFADSGGFVLSLIVLLIYVLVGIGFYWSTLSWHLLDVTLFIFTSFTTIGYGTHPDSFFDPNDRHSTKYAVTKLFTTIYIMVGMGVLGMLAGSCGSYIKKRMNEAKAARREARLKQKQEHNGSTPRSPTTPREEEEVEAVHQSIAAFALKELRKLVKSLLVLAGVIFLGAFMFMYLEDLLFIDAVYFAVVTASTVGYGDIYPEQPWSKMMMILYVPFAVVLLSRTILTVARIPIEYRELKIENYVLDQFGEELTGPDFADLKRSVCLKSDDDLRKNDFTLAMLLRLGRIHSHDIERIERVFFQLDKDRSGLLDAADLQDLVEFQKSRRALNAAESKHFLSADESSAESNESKTDFKNPMNDEVLSPRGDVTDEDDGDE